ncbi:unnamed protein product [Peniophora sp. CBMAI 1063]|nr:unnamed protein product [Peniophora sp. CBMAI 1063]
MSNETIPIVSLTNSSDVAVTMDLSKVSSGQMITACFADTAAFVLISQRAYAYIVRGGKGSTFRTVLCLWLLSATRLIWGLSAVYLAYSQQSEPQVRSYTQRSFLKIVVAGVAFFIATLCIYACITIVVWKEISSAVGKSKLTTSLSILLLWIPPIFVDELETDFALTHILAVTQMGVHGTTHAVISPRDKFSTHCLRLRMPSRLHSFTHAQQPSRVRRSLVAVIMCAANFLIIHLIVRIYYFAWGFIPGGPFIGLSDVYSLLYLNIKIKHAAIGSSGGSELANRAPEELEMLRPSSSAGGAARSRAPARSVATDDACDDMS